MKNRIKFFVIGCVLSLSTVLVAAEEGVHTPAAGSPERQAIMDSIRVDFYGGNRDAAHRNGKQVFFKVGFLRVHNDWACASVIPVNAAGKELQNPRWVLLWRKSGRWSDVNYFDALRPFASENGVV